MYLLCQGLCVTASYGAGKCAAENVAMCVVLGRANIGGEFRQCLELL